MEIANIERHLLPLVMSLRCVAPDKLGAVKGSEYAGKEVTDRQVKLCPDIRDRSCPYGASCGAIRIQRACCQGVGSPWVLPLDAKFNLSERLLIRGYGERADSVLGGHSGVSAMKWIHSKMATLKLCMQRAVKVATADMKGVIVRKPQGAEVVLEKASVDPGKPWQKMATGVSTYVTQRPVPTTHNIVREVLDHDRSDSKLIPQDKITWGCLTDGPQNTIARLKNVVDKRLSKDNELVCILDTEYSLWALVRDHFEGDFFLLKHCGEAAISFRDGRMHSVAREFVPKCLKMPLYKHMRYEICLADGYPIGSGAVESACRNVINARLKRAGMSWTMPAAEDMMRLQAVHVNKDWDSSWNQRRHSERRRSHGIDETSSVETRDHELPRARSLMTDSNGPPVNGSLGVLRWFEGRFSTNPTLRGCCRKTVIHYKH